MLIKIKILAYLRDKIYKKLHQVVLNILLTPIKTEEIIET